MKCIFYMHHAPQFHALAHIFIWLCKLSRRLFFLFADFGRVPKSFDFHPQSLNRARVLCRLNSRTEHPTGCEDEARIRLEIAETDALGRRGKESRFKLIR